MKTKSTILRALRAILPGTAALAGVIIATAPANAGDFTVPANAVTGSHGGDTYGTGMPALINGSGITRPDLTDPATWTFNGGAYQDEWMGSSLVVGGVVTPGLNGKCAWASFDLATSSALSKLWLFNINYGGGVAGAKQYNLYYANSPAVALPARPNNNVYATTGLTPQGDYDFSSTGWTKFNTSGVLTAAQNATTSVDLSGVTARYIAVEIISNYGDTYAKNRVGFDEVAITRIVSDMTWVGQGGNMVGDWSAGANWDPGLYTDRNVIINAADSVVTVDAAASAARVSVGKTAASSLVIPSGKTLTVSYPGLNSSLTIGASGSLTVDGTLAVPVVFSSGAVTLNPTAILSGVSSITLNGAAGVINAPSGVTLSGTKLLLDNTTNNNSTRINDTANVTLGPAGEFYLQGNASANTTESIATLGIAGGDAKVTAFATANSRLVTLAGNAFSRTANGTALFRGTSLGQAATKMGKVTLTDASGLSFVGNDTLAGAASGDTTKTVRIVPYLIGGTSETDTGSSLVTYDTTYGFCALNPTNQFTTLTAAYATPATHENVKSFSGTITADSPAVNSLLFGTASNQTLSGTGTLTVDSGVVALVVANTGAISGFSGVTLGDGTWNEGVITVTQNTLTLNVPVSVTGSGGLTKAGAGTLRLSVAPVYSGDTTVNAGTLRLDAANTSNDLSSVTIAATGATLNLTFAGTDTVDKLYIGSTQMAAGVYGAGNIVIPQITGTGTLTVISNPVDTTPPTLAGSGIADDKSGGPVLVNTMVTYTVTFSEDIDATTVDASDFGNAGSAAVTIGTVTETTPISGIFTVQATPTSAGTLQLQVNQSAEIKDVAGNALNTASAIADDTTLTVLTSDTTPPTLPGSNIVDNKGGGPIAANTLVTYTVTFSEDIDDSTVDATDFGNAGSAPVTIGTIAETTPTSGVFTVEVTPTSGGTLQFQVNAGAVLTDTAGNPLNTSSAIPDDSTIAVDGIPPTLATTDIVDNQSGGPVQENTMVTYTVTFSEDLNATTVDASDFGNAGTAPISFGTVIKTGPGVFAVQVTPTGTGTLQLQVNAGAVLTDGVGNPLDTTSAIPDDTTLTVDPDTTMPTPDPLTWASAPAAINSTSIAMTATTATDPSGVEYYFECTAGGGHSSAWQNSATYTDTGLLPNTSYTYRVQARDKSLAQNTTGFSATASATTLLNVTGSHGGDGYSANGLNALVNGSGMIRPNLADPSTWTVNYSGYPEEWMGNYLVGASNSKIAWVSFDLGESANLLKLYLWNIRYAGGVAGTATYNLYYADSPTVVLPAQPNAGAYSVTGLTPQGDYDFSGAGWTKFNTSGALGVPQAGNSIVDLSGVSARYIALEILTNYGDTYLGGRVGFLETAITRTTTPMVGYAAWQATNGTTGTINEDHDNDGVPNGIEYFIGGNTNTTGFTALPGVDNTAGTLSVTWTKGSGYSGIYGTDFVVETSDTLTGTWTPETLAPSGQVTDDPGFVKYTFPSPLGSKKFARLKVFGP